MKTYTDHLSPGLSFPAEGKPCILVNHIDGPLLTFRDGQMHWLTIWERLQFWLGLTDAERLEKKLRPKLMLLVDQARVRNL